MDSPKRIDMRDVSSEELGLLLEQQHIAARRCDLQITQIREELKRRVQAMQEAKKEADSEVPPLSE